MMDAEKYTIAVMIDIFVLDERLRGCVMVMAITKHSTGEQIKMESTMYQLKDGILE